MEQEDSNKIIFTDEEIKALKQLAKEKIKMEEFLNEMYGRREEY